MGYAPEGGSPILTFRAQYSYAVREHEVYVGEYEQSVQSSDEGEQLLRSFKAGPLYARYQRSRPWESVLDPYRDVLPLE